MSKHTPGPWDFEVREGGHPLNDQNGWGCEGLWAVNGGLILGSGQGWDGDYSQPNEANARLIEAAPDLLEALMLYVNDDNQTHTDRERKAIARAAINKATREHHE